MIALLVLAQTFPPGHHTSYCTSTKRLCKNTSSLPPRVPHYSQYIEIYKQYVSVLYYTSILCQENICKKRMREEKESECLNHGEHLRETRRTPQRDEDTSERRGHLGEMRRTPQRDEEDTSERRGHLMEVKEFHPIH